MAVSINRGSFLSTTSLFVDVSSFCVECQGSIQEGGFASWTVLYDKENHQCRRIIGAYFFDVPGQSRLIPAERVRI